MVGGYLSSFGLTLSVAKFDCFDFFISSIQIQILQTMQRQYEIEQEIYTNSFLIYPHFDEDNLTRFYWQRKNPYFSTCQIQRIHQSVPQLSYQCNLLDYRSTIQLVILVKVSQNQDENQQKRVFSYGPTKLQPDLMIEYKNQIPKHIIQIRFDKKSSLCANVTFSSQKNNLIIGIQTKNNLLLNFRYRIDKNTQHIFCQGSEPHQLYLNFKENKKQLKKILKTLQIYSLQGNYLKIAFEDQIKKDLFMLGLLVEMGFHFDELKENYFPQYFKKRKNQENFITENTINSCFATEKDVFASLSPNKSRIEVFSNENKQQKNSSVGKLNGKTPKNSRYIQLQKNRYFKKLFDDQPGSKTKLKEEIKRDKLDQSRTKKHDGDYLALLKRFEKVIKENQFLRIENKQLKSKLRQNNPLRPKSRDIPEFIKIMQINKVMKGVMNEKQTKITKRNTKNPETNRNKFKVNFYRQNTEQGEEIVSNSSGKETQLLNMRLSEGKDLRKLIKHKQIHR